MRVPSLTSEPQSLTSDKKETKLKPITKVVIVIVAVAAVAAGIILAQMKLRKGESFTTLTQAELTAMADTLSEAQKRQLAQSEAQRKEIIKNVKQMYALATAAQAEGLDKTEQFKRRLALSIDQLLAAEDNTRNPQAEIPKAERDAYLAAHARDFEEDLKLVTGSEKPTPEQIETLKGQWAELKLRAERARKAGLDKDAAVTVKLKFQQAQELARAYTQSLQEKLKPSPEELKKYFEQHPEADMERIKKRAEEVLARVKKGEDFATLAQQFSDDKVSGEKGGDLGWFERGKMVQEFEDAAFALQPGQTSELVKSQFGFHIIKLEDRRIVAKKEGGVKPSPTPATQSSPEPAGPKEEVKARHILISTQEAEGIEQMLTQQKVQRAIEDVTLKYQISAPEDFPVNVSGVSGNRGLRLPRLGGGQGGPMAPIIPDKK